MSFLTRNRHRPVDASQVMPGLLIGSAPDAGQVAQLVRQGVTVVVDLRAERENEGYWPPTVTLRKVPVVDHTAQDPREIAELARWVVEEIGRGEVVLIHCHAGMGRAATAGCAVLIELGYGVADAYNTMREARPVIAPTDAQVALLRLLDRAHRPVAS